MYTRCPICKTNFSVTEAQLQVAQGKVRCGSCKNVFNARQHIHYRSAAPTTVKDKPAPATRQTAPVTEPKPETSNTPTEHSDIDAIFNALDSQLTSGTYIDIAQPADTDIREADFDNSNDPVNETDEAAIYQQPIAEDNTEYNSGPDLDLKSSGDWNLHSGDYSQPTKTNTHDTKEPDNNKPTPASNERTGLLNAFDNIKTRRTQAKKQKPPEKNSPQHTFDFVSLKDEPDLAPEDEKQFAAVNQPLDTKIDARLKKQSENAALHAAIDNIIKVDSKITTPFEEQDEHHFVIEMHNEPDVELVDENDIDKLFASTDSLKMSDLKFDKHLTNSQTEEPFSILGENKKYNHPTQEHTTGFELEADSDNIPDDISTQTQQQANNETTFNLQVEEQLKPEDFNPETSKYQVDDEFNEADFDPDKFTLNNSDNDFDIEEEIILASDDSDKNTHNIPHQLRDTVASFEQQTPPPGTAKRAVYSLVSIFLILLLATQLVLFKSTALANSIPALQPLLTSLCNNLPCRYTGNHNSKLIKIASRDVRLHPKIKGALLISATIVNQASYSQPYPTILLKFTDLSGATVAQRYFPPKDYLGQLNKPFALMPSKKPVQLNIEILDPGSDAINFQFFFL